MTNSNLSKGNDCTLSTPIYYHIIFSFSSVFCFSYFRN
nr:MAG TPA: hypothetical protein [Caudoviricetes sp.]